MGIIMVLFAILLTLADQNEKAKKAAKEKEKKT